MHLLVTGGSGFIGRRICSRAVGDGHEVTSVARSGAPPTDQQGPWAADVTWRTGDVFAPDGWRDALADVDTVVHAIGTLSEDAAAGVTFDRVNGDSALVAALEAERAGVDRFVYVSSSSKPPFVDERYLTARRRAEDAIADLDMTVTVPRFGPVYGPDQPHFPTVVNWLFTALGSVEPLARRFGPDRPVAVDRAAGTTYELATMADPPTGPVTTPQLLELAGQG